MEKREPRYSKEEFVRRGTELYEQQVRPKVEDGNHGRIVAIDIETGEYEVADSVLAATSQLFARVPDTQPGIVRIGHRYVDRLGFRVVAPTP
jgi:hypothetical protein